MATDTTTQPMTTDEFLQLADEEGVTRELIDGELVERPVMLTFPIQSVALSRIGTALNNWLDIQTETVGVVACGEVRCRLATDPDLIVGVDVVYYEGEESIRQAGEQSFFDGPPIIAVEVLSPSDTHENVVEKIRRYLSTGTKQVWIADPDLRTVTIHRANANATLCNANQELTAEPELPRFRVAVKDLFLNK
jgi:Uma2 family endonuclease